MQRPTGIGSTHLLGGFMKTKIACIILTAMVLALVAFIWWPDPENIVTYHGKDLLARIAFSVMAVGFIGSRIIAFYDKWS